MAPKAELAERVWIHRIIFTGMGYAHRSHWARGRAATCTAVVKMEELWERKGTVMEVTSGTLTRCLPVVAPLHTALSNLTPSS